MDKLFQAQEIGSLAKPNWRVRKILGQQLKGNDYADLDKWGSMLGIDTKEAKGMLKSELTEESRKSLMELSSLFAVRLQEKAGLDIIFNGEQFRVEMYQEPVENIEGFRFCGEVRSFDNKYYNKAAVVSKPACKNIYHLSEFDVVKKQTAKEIKVPITGAYTLADWSFNEHYMRKWKAKASGREASLEAKREFTLDLAREVIRPNIKALADAGARIIQVDEPAAGTKPDEVGILVESFNESVKGIGCKFVVHNCYSDYRSLIPAIFEMKKCRQFTLEFANRDHKHTDGYRDIELFRQHNDNRELGLGVVNVHSNEIETAELVRDRILGVSKALRNPALIYVNPDCGLRTRSWEVSFAKLSNMAKGAEMARG